MDEDKTVAIIGIGCRFPGANNKEEFWKLLLNGENHITEVRKHRLGFESHLVSDPAEPNKKHAYKAGLLDRFAQWDNKVFGIPDQEAKWVDPQQRFVLDCVHMALEDAGITRQELSRTNTGVYIGAMNDDFRSAILEDADNEDSSYMVTGLSLSIISARVSYVYNLFGPSMTIDTACSSSLVAIHQGSLSLRAGECEMAICGGVNLILDPRVFVSLANARMLSPSGQCHSFSSKADGYTRGEGCGIVILKQLHNALRDGNKIWGLIGTGINQDGHMVTPITAPSGEQQLALLRRIYGELKVSASSIQVIEAHGTGTPVGDPVEANSIGTFFNEHSSSDIKYIGSVKSNIGHLESASGVAGLIKIILMMKNETIVPSLHVKQEGLNVRNNLAKNRLIVPTEPMAWPLLDGRAKMACVNNFGFGGTNAHAIVSEYIEQSQKDKRSLETGDEPVIVLLSSTSLEGLHHNISKLIEKLDTVCYNIHELSFTSVCKREHFPVRAGFVAKDQIELATKCKLFHATWSEASDNKVGKKIVFVFCGVGTVWRGMCSKLLEKEAFASTLYEIDRLLKVYTGWSIVEKLGSDEIITNPLIGHISIFTCQVCLFEMWKSFGILPDCIVGQSVGEVAACYACGAISLETAVKIIYKRSLHLSNVTGGKMIVISGLHITSLETMCQANNVSIAVRNSPMSATISGDTEEIRSIRNEMARLQSAGNDIQIKELQTSCAYHSCYVDDAKSSFMKSLTNIEGCRPKIPIVSTVTGDYLENEDFTKATYWGKNIRSTVKFYEAIKTSAHENGKTVFIEIGPSPVLAPHIKSILPENRALCLPSIKAKDDTISWRQSLVELYQIGFNPKWDKVVQKTNNITDIPQYQFVGKEFSPPNGFVPFTFNKSENSHLYIKQQKQLDSKDHQYKIKLEGQEIAFVAEHFVRGQVIVPGALYADIGFEVGITHFNKSLQDLEVELQFLKILPISPSATTEISISVEQTANFEEGHYYTFEAISDGNIRAVGNVGIVSEICYKRLDISDIKSKFMQRISKADSYNKLRLLGFKYGESFSLLDECWVKSGEVLSKLKVPQSIVPTLAKTHIHPVILDGMMQTSVFALNERDFPRYELIQAYPVGIGSIRIMRSPRDHDFFSYLHVTNITIKEFLIEIHANILLLDIHGFTLVEAKNVTVFGKLPDILIPRELKYVAATKLYQKPSAVVPKGLDNIVLVHTDTVTKDSTFFDHLNTLSVHIKSIDDNLSDLLWKKSNEKWGGLGYISRVIFMPTCSSFDTEALDGLRIMTEVKKNCLIFIQIIKAVKDLPQQPPIFVITENTQGLIQSEKNPINIIGSEMWGLVRCFLREMVYLNVYLLDIVCWKENVSLVQSIISQSKESLMTFPSEIILDKMKLFVPQLQCAPTTEKQSETRTIAYRSCDQVLLKSRSPYSSMDTYLIPNRTSPEQVKPGWIKVEVETIYLQDTHSQHPFLRDINGSNVDIANNGKHPVMSLEFTGYIQYADVQKSSVTGKLFRHCQSEILPNDDYPSKAKVVVCYPIEIGSFVTVPISCVVRKDGIPNYFPGQLTYTLQVLTLLQLLPKHHKIVLFIANNDIRNKYISDCVRSNRCNVDIIDLKNLVVDNVARNRSATAVLLTALESEQEQSFIAYLQYCRQLIFMRNHLIQNVQDTIKLQTRTKCICLNENKIFSERNISRFLPKVITLLQKNKIHQTLESGLKNSVQYPVLDLKSGSGKSALKIELEKSQLFDKMSSYIIVGGLTGLGLILLKLIAEMGAGVIATFSRRGNLNQKDNLIRQIEQNTGCAIICLKADVSDMKSLRQAFSDLNAQFPRHAIRGIFQGAGVIDSNLFLSMKGKNFDSVMFPKVAGSWNLHRLSMSLPLNYFVLHSSITGVLGAGGDSNYGAANTFLDTLAIYRRKKGLPGQSIAWGGLAVGMAAGDQFAKNFETKGYLRLDENQIKECFINALMQDHSHVVYTKQDWYRIAHDHKKPGANKLAFKIDPILRRKNLKASETNTEMNKIPSINWEDFWNSEQSGKLNVITEVVSLVIAEVSNVDLSDLQSETMLADGGIDSLSAIHFTNIISEIFNCRVPIALTTAPDTTIKVLIKFLADNIDKRKIIESESAFDSSIGYQRIIGLSMADGIGVTYTDSGLLADEETVSTKL
ncbi:hypothetical protein CHS0354_037653 [Potamilus streckersoni]|uniref:Uncharacterized protein n=1 Tax=Potamilus streckersoni TaxID=2493646 RepID=A0AAE0T897_9BIVA|nr:hypothetical protein CHS0354_037653 [Potamilus streckersoni]